MIRMGWGLNILIKQLGMAVLTLSMCLAACGEDRSAVAALQRETEEVHDVAMRDLADMNRVKRSLKAEMTELDSLALRRDSILSVLALMETADADMMSWMANYKPPADTASVKAALDYLKKEKEKISANGNMIRAAKEAGRKLQSK